MATDRVIVIGAGIGGASAALSLQRAGIAVRLFERADEPQDVGAGIQIWVNGMVALQRLRVLEAVQQQGGPMDVQELGSWRGSLLIRIPVAELAERHGLPRPVLIKRADLLATLTGALDDGVLNLASGVASIEQDHGGVTVRFADGREERAAVVVAADGIGSDTRKALFGPIEPRWAGYQYLRAISTHEDPSIPPEAFKFMIGRRDRFGLHAGRSWTYWFGVLLVKPESGDPPEGRKQQLLARFEGFGRTVTDFIESVPEEEIGRTDIRDLDPLERYVNGRVVLVGDAAHATTPNLGRGAGEALDDAIAIAAHLSEASSLSDSDAVADALRRFDEQRRPAASDVQTRARRIGKLFAFRDPVRVAVREQIMRRAAGPRMVRKSKRSSVSSVRRRAR
jgi:FAD-dependent urate hydroxylase